MIPEVEVFAEVAAIVVCLVGSLALIGVVTARALKGKEPTKSLPDDQRLDHLQQSIDAIAIEVERIAEAQRFSAKLLAERSEPDALSR